MLEHKSVIEEARREQMNRLAQEQADQKKAEQKPKPTPKAPKFNPKSERHGLLGFTFDYKRT